MHYRLKHKLVLVQQPPIQAVFLDISSTNKGLLIPRMTRAERDLISSPATGLLIYQTNLGPGFYYYNGAIWQPIYPGGDNLGNHLANQNIKLNGYYLSKDGDNEGIFVNDNGNVGIKTNTPNHDLQIHNPSSSDATLQFTHASTSGLGFLIQNNNAGVSIINYENLPLYFGTNGSNRMVISSSGEVGIGTSTPNQLLHLRRGTSNLNIYLQNADNVVNAGDPLAKILVGDAYPTQNQAMIMFKRDGVSSGSSDLPTSISFWTTKDGANSPLEQMIINNNGNVGIGIAAPNYRLDVGGVINSQVGYLVNGVAPAGQYLRGNGSSFVPSTISAADIPPGSTSYIQNQIAADQPANFRISNTSLNTAIIRSTSTTTNSAVLVVENTQNTTNATLGISAVVASSNTNTAAIKGTATGTAAAVTGVWGESSSNSNFSSGVYGRQTGSGQTYGVYGINTGNGNLSAGTIGSSDATTAQAYGVQGVANSNNTGSAGVYGLHNHTSAAVNGVIGEVLSSNANAKAIYGKAPSSGFGGYFEGKGYFSGLVGIGITPSTPLHILYNTTSTIIRVQSNNTGGTWHSIQNSSTGGQWFHLINTGLGNGEGVGKFMIIRGTGSSTTTGNPSIIVQHIDNFVGINTANPDQMLSVNGDASKLGGSSWLTFSDQRLKTQISPFQRGLNDLMKIQPVFYQYKKDNPLGIVSEETYTGFIAQEIEKIIPEAIVRSKNHHFLSLNHDPILWTTLNAVKELNQIKADKQEMELLKQENQNLKLEIQNLKNQLNDLEKSVKRLESNFIAK